MYVNPNGWYKGVAWSSNDPRSANSYEHGTHTAGIITGNTFRTGVPNARLAFGSYRGPNSHLPDDSPTGLLSYVEWCIEATERWPEFAENLETETGFDLNYEKTGGLEICLGEEEHQERINFIEEMSQASRSGRYDCEMISRKELQGMLPKIKLGKEVSGASFCSHDGCVNPLTLLKAMNTSFQQKGGGYRPEQSVQKIECSSNDFKISTSDT